VKSVVKKKNKQTQQITFAFVLLPKTPLENHIRSLSFQGGTSVSNRRFCSLVTRPRFSITALFNSMKARAPLHGQNAVGTIPKGFIEEPGQFKHIRVGIRWEWGDKRHDLLPVRVQALGGVGQ
jgi:hypothetical protein